MMRRGQARVSARLMVDVVEKAGDHILRLGYDELPGEQQQQVISAWRKIGENL